MMCMLLRRWMAAVAVLWAAQKDRERPVEIGGGSGPYFNWYFLVFVTTCNMSPKFSPNTSQNTGQNTSQIVVWNASEELR